MSLTGSSRIWDDSTSPDIAHVARRYEADLRRSPRPGFRPELDDYLPSDPELRPAALLALLRIDLALRWKDRERVPVEWYRDRYPDLRGESLVTLIYEEFCLREEAGESPGAEEYDARFPEVAASFREVLEIHGLIGQDRLSGTITSVPPATLMPEVGQTIAGFRLVEELGRGSFARVFRAEERQLADRPVAMKVSRTGSREPQTLARLQHTHIVPVYSYRTDPATGLHLLCMPYLGRLTLAQVLADPAIRQARTGADLALLLDRLQVRDGAIGSLGLPVSRSALARPTFARAIAWWGARLAEALQHAHERGVLHRDIKPSNILVTDDGLPMLLDFNLAQEPWIDSPDAAPAGLGGTLAYMAPEQLEALAVGRTEWTDARSDLYALGVVLSECLVRGERMFSLPSEARNLAVAIELAAEARRAGPPLLHASHPDVPAAFDAVLQRCLASDPDDRYANASELVHDLQAVADDGPLYHAREPLPSRSLRWLRRNRRRLALAAPLILAFTVAAMALFGAQMAGLRIEAEVKHRISEGKHAFEGDQLELAESHFATAARLASSESRLKKGLHGLALAEGRRARLSKEVRDRADELFAVGERLRFGLLGFPDGDRGTACREVEAALAKFSIPRDLDWMRRPSIQLLDPRRRARLFDEVNDLLFLWVVVLDRDRPAVPAAARRAVRICDVALGFATPTGPWRALRDRHASPRRVEPLPLPIGSPAAIETSSRGCYQWGLLCKLEGRDEATIAWLERAVQLDPSDYWSQFYLGYYHQQAGHSGRALEAYQAAVALRPHSPWARFNRALLHSADGDWVRAGDDLERALATAQGFDSPWARLELGLVKQEMGDAVGARAAYDSVIAAGKGSPLAHLVRLNRAKLDIDSGAVKDALAEYDALLAEDSRDAAARLGRALLALRLGDAARAEADLTLLLRDDPANADELFARRALAHLALGQRLEAEADAADAYRRKPSPSRRRLWIRTLLALGRVEDLLWLKEPDDLAVLPSGGASLRDDLRAAAERLSSPSRGFQVTPALIHRTRAVILSALDDPAALTEAGRAIALAPESDDAYLVSARVRRRAGDRLGALGDVESGLALEPADPRLLELQGLLDAETGHPGAALVVLDRAINLGAPGTVHAARAVALSALGRDEAAVEEWSLTLTDDREDPLAYLGRARALLRLRLWDRALADLDEAAEWAGDDPALLIRVTLASARCLPARPDRFPRWLSQARRAWLATIAHSMPGRSR